MLKATATAEGMKKLSELVENNDREEDGLPAAEGGRSWVGGD